MITGPLVLKIGRNPSNTRAKIGELRAAMVNHRTSIARKTDQDIGGRESGENVGLCEPCMLRRQCRRILSDRETAF